MKKIKPDGAKGGFAMKKLVISLAGILLMLTLAAGCTPKDGLITTTTEVTGNQQDVTVPYQTITPEQAKALIDAGGAVILDVRQPDEYATGHIRGAVLLPVGEIEAQAATVLPDKNTKILIYCRSGNRSAVAAAALQTLGYTDVSDFGGIIDWPYDDYVVK